MLSLPLGARPGEFRLSTGAEPLRAILSAAPPEPAAAPPPAPREPGPGRSRAESPGITPPAGLYFPPSLLTEPPRPLAPLPLELLRRVVVRPGTAELVLLIDESGGVTGIEVQSSTLPPAAIARAEELLRGARFAPGRIGDLAVKSRLGVTVTIEDRAAGEGSGTLQ